MLKKTVLKILENTLSSPYCTWWWLFDIVPIWEMHQLQFPLWSWSVKLTTRQKQHNEFTAERNQDTLQHKRGWPTNCTINGERGVCARDMASAGWERVGWLVGWSGVGGWVVVGGGAGKLACTVPEGLCRRHPTLHSRCHVAIHSRSHQLQNMRKIQLSLILRTLMTQ